VLVLCVSLFGPCLPAGALVWTFGADCCATDCCAHKGKKYSVLGHKGFPGVRLGTRFVRRDSIGNGDVCGQRCAPRTGQLGGSGEISSAAKDRVATSSAPARTAN
jgi:hypothetical protein